MSLRDVARINELEQVLIKTRSHLIETRDQVLKLSERLLALEMAVKGKKG